MSESVIVLCERLDKVKRRICRVDCKLSKVDHEIFTEDMEKAISELETLSEDKERQWKKIYPEIGKPFVHESIPIDEMIPETTLRVEACVYYETDGPNPPIGDGSYTVAYQVLNEESGERGIVLHEHTWALEGTMDSCEIHSDNPKLMGKNKLDQWWFCSFKGGKKFKVGYSRGRVGEKKPVCEHEVG
jgi:hypothetical protein